MLLLTYNALFAYYARKGDVENARYFREAGFKLSWVLIGWKRFIALFGETLRSKSLAQLLSALRVFLSEKHLVRNNPRGPRKKS